MSNDLAVKKSQLTNAIKQMSDYLNDKIVDNTNSKKLVNLFGKEYAGKALYDALDNYARKGFYGTISCCICSYVAI